MIKLDVIRCSLLALTLLHRRAQVHTHSPVELQYDCTVADNETQFSAPRLQ